MPLKPFDELEHEEILKNPKADKYIAEQAVKDAMAEGLSREQAEKFYGYRPELAQPVYYLKDTDVLMRREDGDPILLPRQQLKKQGWSPVIGSLSVAPEDVPEGQTPGGPDGAPDPLLYTRISRVSETEARQFAEENGLPTEGWEVKTPTGVAPDSSVEDREADDSREPMTEEPGVTTVNAEPPSGIEELVRAVLPDPVRELELDDTREPDSPGVVPRRFVGGDPGEVLIELDHAGIAVSMFEVFWEGPHTPLVRGKSLAGVSWEDLPVDTDEAKRVIGSLVEAARAIRWSKFRRCAECGEVKPPEWMHEGGICQGCAERNHGVVY